MPQYVEVPGHGVVEFPDGMNDDQIASAIKANMQPQEAPQQEESLFDSIKQGAGNLVAGGVRGAGSIGSTILYPWDKAQDMYYGDREQSVTGLVTGKQPMSRNEERRAAIDAGLQAMGADPESLMYKGGKLATEIGGTAGVGGVLAKGVQAIPALAKAAPSLATALQSGGFKLGQTATNKSGMLANALLRTGAGGTTGAAMSGLVNPEDAGTGAVFGAAMPGAFKIAGEAGIAANKAGKAMARRLMQSALKPTIKQLKTGDAKVAVDTLLEYGINPNAKGVEKMQGMVDDINTVIADKLRNSTATVSRPRVLDYLDDVRGAARNQVSPSADLNAIKGVADDFSAHPGIVSDNIPVQQAQELKKGTYRALRGQYGQARGAEIESQKALARGLKDQIAKAVPGIGPLNAEEARLLKTLDVAERRALMELNKNPVGLSLLAGNKAAFIGFMADKSAAFKALAARAINRASETPSLVNPLADKLANPALRGGVLSISGNQAPQQ